MKNCTLTLLLVSIHILVLSLSAENSLIERRHREKSQREKISSSYLKQQSELRDQSSNNNKRFISKLWNGFKEGAKFVFSKPNTGRCEADWCETTWWGR